MKSGAKSESGFRPVFGPFSIGTLSTGPKNGPISGSEFGRRGTATTLTWSSLLESQNLGADQKSVPDAVR